MNKRERDEWLKSLKVGDEVCYTNKYNIAKMLFGGLMGKSEEAEVCQIFKVRGVLHDGAIVAANGIFNSEGKIESEAKHEYAALSMNGELVEPTDELRELAKRLEIISSLKKVDWDKIKTSIMVEVINLIKNNE